MSVKIPTSVTQEEIDTLKTFASKKRVLEVGSLLGYSTTEIASVAEHVVSVDPHKGYPDKESPSTWEPFMQNLREKGVLNKVTPFIGNDQQVFPYFATNQFDLAFIDTTGEYEDTYRIMNSTKSLLRYSAVLAVHDFGHPEWPGAAKAIYQFAEEQKRTFFVVNTLAVFTGVWA